MPLQLGDDSHSRPRIIAWDATCEKQTKEAATEIEGLESKGFKAIDKKDGLVTLSPPTRDPNQGLFRILSQNGDDHVVWDRRDPAQVREAFAKFNELVKKGYTAYSTTSDGKKGHKIDTFDPGLEEIILVPSTMPG